MRWVKHATGMEAMRNKTQNFSQKIWWEETTWKT